MEETEVTLTYRSAFSVLVLMAIGGLAFAAGIAWASVARADEGKPGHPKIVYPRESRLNLDDVAIEGEVQNPGDFYFQHRQEEKFDSLVKRRKNFHREMLRDVVLSK